MSKDFKSQPAAVSNSKDLRKLNMSEFHKYLSFLCLYLQEIHGTELSRNVLQDIDTTLLKIYLRLGYYDNLNQFVSSCNDCVLEVCVPDLEHHNRLESKMFFFLLDIASQD